MMMYCVKFWFRYLYNYWLLLLSPAAKNVLFLCNSVDEFQALSLLTFYPVYLK